MDVTSGQLQQVLFTEPLDAALMLSSYCLTPLALLSHSGRTLRALRVALLSLPQCISNLVADKKCRCQQSAETFTVHKACWAGEHSAKPCYMHHHWTGCDACAMMPEQEDCINMTYGVLRIALCSVHQCRFGLCTGAGAKLT